MGNNLKFKIIEEVEKREREIVEFLQQLIRINSETGREAEIQDFLANSLVNLGLKVDKFIPDKVLLEKQPGYFPVEVDYKNRPNVVGVLDGTGGGKSLILNGHVDTIPAEPITAWDIGPFSGEVRDGKVFGRGASDMKSGIATMTMAVKILKEMKLPLKGSIILEYVVDEEATGYGTLACIARGYKADAGICCETSDNCVQPACIGRLWFYIDVIGKTSGISDKWNSVSPIEKGLKIVEAINDLEKIRIETLSHPLYPDNRAALPCTVCVFHSGTFPSAIPERARLEGSMGTMPYETTQDVCEQLITQIKSVAEADPWMRNHPPVVSFMKLVVPGAEISPEHPIVKTLCQSFRDVTGMSPTISGRTGGSDTRYLIRNQNIPFVIFGPGSTAQMHAYNEHVNIANLMIAVKALALAIYDWCS